MGTLEKLSHAELTNTPPNTAHARVAAIQHNLQLNVEYHVVFTSRSNDWSILHTFVTYGYLPHRGNSARVKILATRPVVT
jgi:helix-turn-helix protein